MSKIVLATCAVLPRLDPDDQRLHAALDKLGVPAEVMVWNDPAVDWGSFDACIIRSTWDYTPLRDEYVAWAERVASQTVLWNPAPVIRWNTDKTYLRELEAQGVPVVETVWIARGEAPDLDNLMQARGWEEIVVKPVVSASGKDTRRLTRADVPAKQTEIQALLAEKDLMIQPFMRSILTTGELSLLYIDGRFSHAVNKRPAPNEFRVQEHLGGILQAFAPTDTQLTLAEEVLALVPEPTLYARIDLLVDADEQPCLSELEVTEPSMYLAHDPDAARRFATTIQQRLKNNS